MVQALRINSLERAREKLLDKGHTPWEVVSSKQIEQLEPDQASGSSCKSQAHRVQRSVLNNTGDAISKAQMEGNSRMRTQFL